MANLSDAGVDIVANKVGDQLLKYIEATNDGGGDYAIVYDGYNTHQNDNGDLVISGSSSGRWAYSNNLEGYFDPERVKQWLGVNEKYEWLNDKDRQKEYMTQSIKSYGEYLKLVEAIKTQDGSITINYTDCDPAMDWMGDGQAELVVVDGELEFTHSFQKQQLSIAGYAEKSDLSEYEAISLIHGDEAAEQYGNYLDECEKKGDKAVSADEWYDSIFEWE